MDSSYFVTPGTKRCGMLTTLVEGKKYNRHMSPGPRDYRLLQTHFTMTGIFIFIGILYHLMHMVSTSFASKFPKKQSKLQNTLPTIMLCQHCKGIAMGTIALDPFPSIRIEPFSLEMLICEALSQIEQQPNIYNVVHVNFSDKMVGVRSLMDKPFVLPLPVGKIYMEEVQVKLGEEFYFTVGSQHIPFGVSPQDVLQPSHQVVAPDLALSEESLPL
ncbi:UPF0183 protein, partial [Mucuna pruriens]